MNSIYYSVVILLLLTGGVLLLMRENNKKPSIAETETLAPQAKPLSKEEGED